MKKRRMYQLLIFLLICMIGLFGCSRTRIIDKISIIHVFGFDQAENGELIGSALIPDYTSSKSSDQIEYLEVQVPNGVLFVPKLSALTSTPIELAKIRVLVFGKSYAEKGIRNQVERFILTPQLGTNIQIVVSTHSAKETLNKFKKEKSLTLEERIENNMVTQSLPRMNLHVFLNHFYGEGMDVYVPMLTIDEKDRVIIEGMGIFKGDKFKLHLTPPQTVLFSLILDKRSQATYKMELDEKEGKETITVRSFQSKSKWDWDHSKEKLNLRLQLRMTLTQYPDRFNIEKPEDVMEIKKLIEARLKEEIEDLLTTFKENEVDPVGIGNIVRSQDKTWEKKSFYEKYPTLPIHVNVNLRIIHSGLDS